METDEEVALGSRRYKSGEERSRLGCVKQFAKVQDSATALFAFGPPTRYGEGIQSNDDNGIRSAALF
jgi:hypothetical protein